MVGGVADRNGPGCQRLSGPSQQTLQTKRYARGTFPLPLRHGKWEEGTVLVIYVDFFYHKEN